MRFLFCLVSFFLITDSFGQSSTIPKITPPSPNAAAFAKYGNIPVSAYTGVPSISVQVYEIKVRDISIPISLSYHASGVKVGEEASRVGLGWVLNSGGVISRNISNKDDFMVDPFAYLSVSNTSPVLPKGPQFIVPNNDKYLQAGTTLSLLDTQHAPNTISVDLYNYITGSSFDYEPDQFSYNFNGYSGKFIIDRSTRLPILEKQEKIEFTFSNDGATWQAKTPDGFKYTFAATEYFVDYNSTGGGEQKSAWYLTEIISAQGEVVTFQYTLLPSDFIKPSGQWMEAIEAVRYSCPEFICSVIPSPPPPSTIPRKKYSNIYLSRIIWKHGKIEFAMGEREDLEGDQRVESVNVFLNKAQLPVEDYQLQDVFTLGYSYFNYTVGGNVFPMPDVTTDRLQKRLKLESLSVLSASLKKSHEYKFNYFENSNELNLPPKNSYARDHWGYYNGKTGNTSLIPVFQRTAFTSSLEGLVGLMGNERSPSATHMQAFSLREIIYPTKGKTKFYYGSNDYDVNQQSAQGTPEIFKDYLNLIYDAQSSNGVLVSQQIDVSDEYVDDNGSIVPIEISAAFRTSGYCYNITGNPNIYFEIVSMDGISNFKRVSFGAPRCSLPTDTDCLYCKPVSIPPPATSSGVMDVLTYKGSVMLPPGKYLWRAFVQSGEFRFQDVSTSLTYWVDSRKRSQLGSNIKYNVAGGLRIERIEDHESVSNKITNIRKFNYHFDSLVNGQTEIWSYGKRMIKPEYSYFEVGWEKKSMNPAPGDYTCLYCVNLVRQSDSFLPASGTQGNGVGYSKVTETFGVNGENGYTQYIYENEQDLVFTYKYPYGNDPYPLKSPSISSKPYALNGMLKSKTDFTAAGIPVQKLSNHYTKKYDNMIYGLDYRKIPTKDVPGIGGSEILMFLYPALNSSFFYLDLTKTMSYDVNGVLLMTATTTNSYENPTHLQLTQSSKEESDGHKTITRYKYPADYTDAQGGSAITQMKTNNFMHTSPVEVTTLDEDGLGVQKYITRDITVYDIFNSKVFPKEKVTLKSNIPLSSLADYVPSAGYNTNTYRKNFSMDYNGDGNIIRIQKTSDIPLAFLWNNRKTLPIAEVTNALANECFYENFEEGVGTAIKSGPLNAHTGVKYYEGDYNATFSIPNARSYTIEYWFYNTQWNYIAKNYTGSMLLSEGTAIDNVRIYPTDAQMKSYTYELMRGVTSIINEAGQVSKFEYDSFGRLALIKDEKGSIEKQYLYHYKEN